jgi:potassium-transporting ATPase KdpC subunit
MLTMIRNAVMSLLVFTILTGLIYPLTVTGIAQTVFPRQANGSIIMKDGKSVGSELIGQQFDAQKYFWSRPSATGPYPYNGAASTGSNQGNGHPDLSKAVQERINVIRKADPANEAKIPVELVTASASGLDPHISSAAAAYQIQRVSKQRNMDEATVRALVAANTEARQLGLLGEPVVNVLNLNLALDELGQK